MNRKSRLLYILVMSLLSAALVAMAPPDDAPRFPVPFHAPWPGGLDWMAAGRLGGSHYEASPFHVNASKYALDFNDDPSERETLVLAIADGVVQKSVCLGGTGTYGCTVVIFHGTYDDHCYESRYAHLSGEPLVEQETWIAQGEPLGRVGATGLEDSTADHLHFAIYRRPEDECSPDSPYKDTPEMAVLPVPMEEFDVIEDGAEILSGNYPVGYPAFTDAQLSDSKEPLPERRQLIWETYRDFLGQYTYGLVKGPVRELDGQQIYYQEFGPHKRNEHMPWYDLSHTIVEANGRAFAMLSPIWETYAESDHPLSRYGMPTTHSYEWYSVDNTDCAPGYRTDFSQTSVVWPGCGSDKTQVIEYDSGHWDAVFWSEPDHFEGLGHRRQDRYIDFRWPDASLPGPFLARDGFSSIWRTKVEGFVRAYKIDVLVQGHVTVYANNKVVFEYSSPDEEWADSSIRIRAGDQRMRVHYWQESGKPGRLRVSVGDALVRKVYALSPEGEVSSTSRTPQPVNRSLGFPPPELVAPVPGLLVDDSDPGFSTSGPPGFWQSIDDGYNSQALWTFNEANQVINAGRWTPALDGPGVYHVYAHIPEHSAALPKPYSASAQYTILHAGVEESVSRNLGAAEEDWLDLGEYYFDADGTEYVQLVDWTSEPAGSTVVLLDTVRWVAVENPGTLLNAASPRGLVYDVVESGEVAQLEFELQNTGLAPWTAASCRLVGADSNPPQAPASLALDGPVPPGETMRWTVQVPIAQTSGVPRVRYQMQHQGEPFGSLSTGYVFILPQKLADMEDLIRSEIEKWKPEDEITAEELVQHVVDMIQQELKRRAEKWLDGRLAECKGTFAMLAAVVAFALRRTL